MLHQSPEEKIQVGVAHVLPKNMQDENVQVIMRIKDKRISDAIKNGELELKLSYQILDAKEVEGRDDLMEISVK